MKKILFFVFLLVLQIYSMNMKAFLFPGKKETAAFHYFKYSGSDQYYRSHLLPDSSSYYNPILPGWYSDPSICKVGDDYFLVTSSFGYFPGVPVFHSRDLLNWKQIGNVLNRSSQLAHLAGQSIDKGGIYAPQISYNPWNHLYYMITTDVGQGTFYVTTSDPFSNYWSDPVWLPEIDGIDPSFFFDGKGMAYIVHKEDVTGQPKQNDHRAIRICRFNVLTGNTYGEDEPMREKGCLPGELKDRDEGPHLYHVGNWYYMICAEGGTGSKHSEVVYRSREIMGIWERWKGNPMITQRDLTEEQRKTVRAGNASVTCSGHADLVERDGTWWAVFLACRPVDGKQESLGRETFLLPVTWTKDSFPYILPHHTPVPLVGRIKGAVRSRSVTFGNFSYQDGFDRDSLAYGWISLRGPVPYRIKKGWFMMSPGKEKVSGKATPAFVGRRIQHHEFTVETQLKFMPEDKAKAGLLIFKNERRNYFLAVGKDSVQLLDAHTVLASQLRDRGKKKIQLKIVSSGWKYSFWYSSGREWKLLAENIDARYTCSSAGGFCGTLVGFYTEK